MGGGGGPDPPDPSLGPATALKAYYGLVSIGEFT